MKRFEYGHTDEVYLCDDGTVLKLFNKASFEQIIEEIKLLNNLKHLNVPRVLSEIFICRGKFALRYTKLEGKSKKSISECELVGLAKFLREFHSLELKSKNPKLFERDRVEEFVKKSKDIRLIKNFGLLEIEPKAKCVIHGDLFWDNIVFEKDRFAGVFDFIDSCEGDPYFELGVVCFSYDLNHSMKKLLLESYGLEVDLKKLDQFIKYALIYYCACRAMVGRDYEDLIEKLERL